MATTFSAIARAAVENFEAGEVKQGGSTITQQLVRNLYIKRRAFLLSGGQPPPAEFEDEFDDDLGDEFDGEEL